MRLEKKQSLFEKSDAKLLIQGTPGLNGLRRHNKAV